MTQREMGIAKQEEPVFRRKLHKHEEDAIINALAVFTVSEYARKLMDEASISTLEAMVGIKGFVDSNVNKAIDEMVRNKENTK